MTLLLAYAVVGVLIVIAAWAVIEHHFAAQHLANQRAAWLHRERLAELAFKVENDTAFPCVARKAVTYLAERAFDERFLKAIHRMPPPAKPPTFVEHIRQEHGDAAAAIVIEALSAMAFIILLSNRTSGVQIRVDSTDVQKMHEDRQEKIRPIRSALSELIVAAPEPVVPELVAA